MPFLDANRRGLTRSHLFSGTLERSNTVPTVTVNCWRQSLHWMAPARCLLPCRRVALNEPQWGQNGPSGQRMASSLSRALSSLVKWGWKMSICPLLSENSVISSLLCQVYNCLNNFPTSILSGYRSATRKEWGDGCGRIDRRGNRPGGRLCESSGRQGRAYPLGHHRGGRAGAGVVRRHAPFSA